MIDVVLPCLNEAAALPALLTSLPPGYRAIVVDDGSTDDSARVATAHGALVVSAPERGFGAAAHAGLAAATAEVVCFLDADGSSDPRQLDRVTGPVRAGEADLMLGRRRPTTTRAWPPHVRAANALLSWRLRRTLGVDIHDLGPMRAARRRDLLNLYLADRRSGYPLEMIVKAARAGWRIEEIDVDYAPRAEGTGTVRGTLRAVRDLSRVLDG